MRFLSFILMLCLAVPPLPATACDMGGDGHGGAMSVGGGSTPAHGTPGSAGNDPHAAHGHTETAAPAAEHPCCDGAAPADSCDTALHCGPGTSAPAIAAIGDDAITVPHTRLSVPSVVDELPPSHSSPPYRPPSA